MHVIRPGLDLLGLGEDEGEAYINMSLNAAVTGTAGEEPDDILLYCR